MAHPQPAPLPRFIPLVSARSLALALAAVALLWMQAPAVAQDEKDLNAQVVVFSYPSGADLISVAYASPPKQGEIEADFAAIAERLGCEVAAPSIRVQGGITSGETELPGLTNWQTGVVDLNPVIQAYKRFAYFRITCFFFGSFPLRTSQNVAEGPVRLTVSRPGPNAVDYLVRVDHSRGLPSDKAIAGSLRTGVESGAGAAWQWVLGLVAILAVVASGTALIRLVLRSNRLVVRTGEGTSQDA